MASNRNPAGTSGIRAGKPATTTAAPRPATLGLPPLGPEAPESRNPWARFWFSAAEPVPLHILRVLTGLLLVFWLLPFAGQVDAFYGQGGWFDVEAYKEIPRLDEKRMEMELKMARGERVPFNPPGSPPPVGWSLLFLFWSNSATLHAFYWGAIAVFLLFALGLWTRLTGILTWLCVVSFLPNPVIRFEPEFLLGILAFYLMIGYGLQGLWSRDLSAAERVLGPRDNFLFHRWLVSPGPQRTNTTESHAANFAVRLLQVHFALIVVISALHKLQFGRHWGGVALFYPLYNAFDYTFDSMRNEIGKLTTNLPVLSLSEYLMLGWQLGFPLFAWRKGLCRMVLVGGGIIGWLGSFFVFGAPLFGPVYLIGCLSYVTATEWQALGRFLREAIGPRRQHAEVRPLRVGSHAGS